VCNDLTSDLAIMAADLMRSVDILFCEWVLNTTPLAEATTADLHGDAGGSAGGSAAGAAASGGGGVVVVVAGQRAAAAAGG
jgi:hypothetical protein